MRREWGQILRDFRMHTRMKQQTLAAALDVSQGYVSRLESGRIEPPPNLVDRIEALLQSLEHLTVLEQIKLAVRHSPTRVCLIQLCNEFRLTAMSEVCREHDTPFRSLKEGAHLKAEGYEEFVHGLELARTGLLQDNNTRPGQMIWTMPTAPVPEFIRSVVVPMMIVPANWFLHITSISISKEEYRQLRCGWSGGFRNDPESSEDCHEAGGPADKS